MSNVIESIKRVREDLQKNTDIKPNMSRLKADVKMLIGNKGFEVDVIPKENGGYQSVQRDVNLEEVKKLLGELSVALKTNELDSAIISIQKLIDKSKEQQNISDKTKNKKKKEQKSKKKEEEKVEEAEDKDNKEDKNDKDNKPPIPKSNKVIDVVSAYYNFYKEKGDAEGMQKMQAQLNSFVDRRMKKFKQDLSQQKDDGPNQKMDQINKEISEIQAVLSEMGISNSQLQEFISSQEKKEDSQEIEEGQEENIVEEELKQESKTNGYEQYFNTEDYSWEQPEEVSEEEPEQESNQKIEWQQTSWNQQENNQDFEQQENSSFENEDRQNNESNEQTKEKSVRQRFKNLMKDALKYEMIATKLENQMALKQIGNFANKAKENVKNGAEKVGKTAIKVGKNVAFGAAVGVAMPVVAVAEVGKATKNAAIKAAKKVKSASKGKIDQMISNSRDRAHKILDKVETKVNTRETYVNNLEQQLNPNEKNQDGGR